MYVVYVDQGCPDVPDGRAKPLVSTNSHKNQMFKNW